MCGLVGVWAVLLACVRPQRLAMYEQEQNKWVGMDKHDLLLQNAGGLFVRHRFGAARYLFVGVWMVNLLCLACILAYAAGEMQLYLMIANEAWIGALYFIWQPHPLRSPVFGGRCHLNFNILRLSLIHI